LEAPRAIRPLVRRQLDTIRAWDVSAAARVDHFVANSQITKDRIEQVWGRDSIIIHPPVAVDRFAVGKPEDYFLIVGELVPHKRVDSALAAAERAGRPVKVVGTGPSLESLRERFGGHAEFLGRLGDHELADVMARARALIVPTVEEFGIAAIEANASGRPVIGPDRGGTRETVVDGQTGVLFPAGDFDALAEVLRDVDFERFDPHAIRRHAVQFRPEAFRRRLLDEVARLVRSGRTRADEVVDERRVVTRARAAVALRSR
jgi:glycosyltransferase involved in cell wall biosynthesis